MTTDVISTQLEFLKLEIESINDAITQQDEITKNVKQWAIVAWCAAVGGALTSNELRPYVGATAAIPFLFWFVDTWHRRIQRKFIWRTIQISKFLNDGRLNDSIRSGSFVNFNLLDPRSREDNSEEYGAFTSWKVVMFFRSVCILYLGMIFLSFILGLSVFVLRY